MRRTRRIATTRKRKPGGKPWYVSIMARKWFLNTVVVLMILGVGALLVQYVWSKANTSGAFNVATWEWDTHITIPQWIKLTPEDFTNQLSVDEFLARSHSIFEENLEKDVAARYETLPYLRKVTRIQKSYPNSLDIAVEWRVPAAKVIYGGIEYLVDGDGVVLETTAEITDQDGRVQRKPVYDESLLDYPLPVIENFAASGPAPVAGKPWPGGGVIAAARMAEFLRPLFEDFARIAKEQPVDPIVSIDVRNLSDPRKSRILLLTLGGKVFEWGNPVGAETSNEPRPEKKLANMQKIYAASPTLASFKDTPLKTWISLQWLDDEIITSDKE